MKTQSRQPHLLNVIKNPLIGYLVSIVVRHVEN